MDFSIGLPDDVKRALEQLTAAAQAQAAQSEPVQQTADGLLGAVPQQQQRPLNPQSLGYMNGLIALKGAYEGAPEGEAGDQTRQDAHNSADRIRAIAQAGGVDLNGIENVSYDQANQNLLERQAKEIADLMDGHGKYARTAAQYFDDEYMNAFLATGSARHAKRIAGDKAQAYQAERVGYLRNAYNVYGRDGNYTNSIGVDILNNIGTEMPAVANVYAQAYPLPKDAQDWANQLEKALVEHGYDIEKLGVVHKNGLETLRENADLTDQNAAKAHERSKDLHEFKDATNYKYRSQQYKDMQNYVKQNAADVNTIYDKHFKVAKLNNASDEEAKQYAGYMTAVEINSKLFGSGNKPSNSRNGSGGGSVGRDNSVDNAKKQVDMFKTQLDAIDAILNPKDGVIDDRLTPEEITALKEKRAQIIQKMGDLSNITFTEQYGSNDRNIVFLDEHSDEEIAETIDYMYKTLAGRSRKKLLDLLELALTQTNATDKVSARARKIANAM